MYSDIIFLGSNDVPFGWMLIVSILVIIIGLSYIADRWSNKDRK